MKKLLQLFTLVFITNANAQIGGGWDWAFNTGSLGGATIKHLKYTADGSEILFGGTALGAAYFGSTTLTAPSPLAGYAGSIHFFGKINAATGTPTIIRSFNNLPISFDCITTDSAGNFYIGGGISTTTPVDLGNGVSVSGFNQGVVAKFSPTGTTLWAKTYTFGITGAATNSINLLAVSNSGNVFFWGFTGNTNANMKRNTPLYKLDSNGDTLWFKDALNGSSAIGNVAGPTFRDKFIDDAENVHLFVLTSSSPFVFDGVTYPAFANTSTIISLNTNGVIFNAIAYNGGVSNFQVNRTTGNLAFKWGQNALNPAPFTNLPTLWAGLSPFYANYFTGMVECDKNLNVLKSKDFSTTIDNPFQLNFNDDIYLALPNGKLLIQTEFTKTGSYFAGVDYGYPADATKYATVLLETDTNWNISKFISGGKANTISKQIIAASGDTYCMSAGFSNYDTSNPSAPATLPTTSYGTVNLTGFNAAPDLTTAYGTFSTTSSLRRDYAIAQTKSPNFPMIASTNWLGLTTNWNTPSNWSNGVPTPSTKAFFNAATTNYPTVSTSPTAATLQVNAGVNLTLPNTLTLAGGLKNDGNITMTDAGFFAGLNANEWRGAGTVTFSGTAATYNYAKAFTNNVVLNTNVNSFQDMTIPTITLNNAKLNLNNKKLSITNPNPSAITTSTTTSNIYGGTLERRINPTGSYDFPMGTATLTQTATVAANNLGGTDRIATTYVNGVLTGTAPNTTYNGVAITSALNGGWFTVNPNQQPTAGNYDMTLKIQGSTNTVPAVGSYTLIKRDNSTSPWAALGNYNLGTNVGGIVTVKNSNLTSFSDFAIGRGASDINLGLNGFAKNSFSLYPNPASTQINLLFNNNLENASLKIVSMLGQIVVEKQNLSGNDFSFDVSNLAKGMYIITIDNAVLPTTSKFIKQ